MIHSLRQFTILVVLCAILSSCVEQSSFKSSDSLWLGVLQASYADIPFRFQYGDSGLVIINNHERILLSEESARGDTLVFSFPQYTNSTLRVFSYNNKQISGHWRTDHHGGDAIEFTARRSDNSVTATEKQPYDHYYDVVFNPDDGKKSEAIGAFRFSKSHSTGTFLTSTGDYRFLEGEKVDSVFWLSTFDGSHLYLAEGIIGPSGSIQGLFYSGNKPATPWVGQLNENPNFPRADSLTTLVGTPENFSFTTQNFFGDTIHFDQAYFKGKVTIVSIIGSWCPNCHDELRLHSQLYRRFKDQQLKMLPIAFEREQSLEKAGNGVQKVFRTLNVPYECYYGGAADKEEASRQFPMLDRVRAFPTSIIIGKDGKVRKIHTGFSGPGTGRVYTSYNEELTAFLEELLAE